MGVGGWDGRSGGFIYIVGESKCEWDALGSLIISGLLVMFRSLVMINRDYDLVTNDY